MSLGESILGVPNDEPRTKLWLVAYEMLFSREIKVDLGVCVLIWTTIRQIRKQLPIIVERTKSSLLLLHCVDSITKYQMCLHAYSYMNYQAHQVEFRPYAAID